MSCSANTSVRQPHRNDTCYIFVGHWQQNGPQDAKACAKARMIMAHERRDATARGDDWRNVGSDISQAIQDAVLTEPGKVVYCVRGCAFAERLITQLNRRPYTKYSNPVGFWWQPTADFEDEDIAQLNVTLTALTDEVNAKSNATERHDFYNIAARLTRELGGRPGRCLAQKTTKRTVSKEIEMRGLHSKVQAALYSQIENDEGRTLAEILRDAGVRRESFRRSEHFRDSRMTWETLKEKRTHDWESRRRTHRREN